MSPYYLTTIAIVALVTGLVLACEEPKPGQLQVGTIEINPPNTILTGAQATLKIDASGADLSFAWAASRGTLSSATQASPIYTAPSSPGPDTVEVTVTGDGRSEVRSINFQVIGDGPVAMVEPTPTDTPGQPPPPESPTVGPTPQNAFIFTMEGEHNVIDPDGKRWEKFQTGQSVPGMYLSLNFDHLGDFLLLRLDQTLFGEVGGKLVDGSWDRLGDKMTLTWAVRTD